MPRADIDRFSPGGLDPESLGQISFAVRDDLDRNGIHQQQILAPPEPLQEVVPEIPWRPRLQEIFIFERVSVEIERMGQGHGPGFHAGGCETGKFRQTHQTCGFRIMGIQVVLPDRPTAHVHPSAADKVDPVQGTAEAPPGVACPSQGDFPCHRQTEIPPDRLAGHVRVFPLCCRPR